MKIVFESQTTCPICGRPPKYPDHSFMVIANRENIAHHAEGTIVTDITVKECLGYNWCHRWKEIVNISDFTPEDRSMTGSPSRFGT